MAETKLTPEEYEMAIRDLQQRLEAYLERGEGDRKQLRREAQDVLNLSNEFPGVYARNSRIEGMVADLLAREQQQKFIAQQEEREAPGCLLGWLFNRSREKS